VGLAGLAMLGSTMAHAAGFYISELGTPASVGTAGAANVTNNFGPDATWANPAGLTSVEDGVMTAGLQIVSTTMEFDPTIATAGGDDGGNAGDVAAIPSFFYHHQLSEKWHYGFGISALQGGGIDYGDDFVGRYGATEVTLEAIAGTFSFAWEATDRLSIGAGASVVYTIFDEKIAINQPGPIADGQIEFDELDDVGVQPIVGLQFKATDNLLLGLSWRGEFDAELEGDLKFKNVVLPVPAQTDMEIDWTNPQWVTAGLAYTTNRGHKWFLSANWQEWSEFSENQVSVSVVGGNVVQTTLDRDWDDTWGVALAYASLFDPEVNGFGWSVGLGYESSPVEDDVRTIDLPMDETWKLSASLLRSRAKGFDWSLALTAHLVGEAEVDQTAQGVRFAGDFDKYFIVFLGATARF
jgi:long-chain fatty acid transport protein